MERLVDLSLVLCDKDEMESVDDSIKVGLHDMQRRILLQGQWGDGELSRKHLQVLQRYGAGTVHPDIANGRLIWWERDPYVATWWWWHAIEALEILNQDSLLATDVLKCPGVNGIGLLGYACVNLSGHHVLNGLIHIARETLTAVLDDDRQKRSRIFATRRMLTRCWQEQHFL